MSMPVPLHVALVGSSRKQVALGKRHFRLSVPGMGPAYLSALDAIPGEDIVHPSKLPKRLMTLWVALDAEAFDLCNKLHAKDLRIPGYSRWFYDEDFPEACILIQAGKSNDELKKALTHLRERIISAYNKN